MENVPSNGDGSPQEFDFSSVKSAWSLPSEVKSAPVTSSGFPGVPTSPMDVNIRTMVSDIRSMGESGGGMPIGKSIAVEIKNDNGIQSANPPTKKPRLSLWIIVAIIGASVLFLASYYLIFPFISGLSNSGVSPVEEIENKTNTGLPSKTAAVFLGHESFFVGRVDSLVVVKLPLSQVVSSINSYRSQIASLTTTPSDIESFFEINIQSQDGRQLSFVEFTNAIGADIFNKDFLLDNFGQDFTTFVYKDSSGIWPGFVLKPNDNKPPLLLKSQITKIEKPNDSIQNIFITSPSSPLTFRDGQIDSQPVRILEFSDKSSKLIYGWFLNKYLVISTSEDGLKEAIGKL
jgi:hypothetical protein